MLAALPAALGRLDDLALELEKLFRREPLVAVRMLAKVNYLRITDPRLAHSSVAHTSSRI